MTRDELNNAYFDWMYQLVCDDEYSRGLSYRKLLSLLHDTDFTYTIALDGNRYDDGIDLRYRFGNCLLYTSFAKFTRHIMRDSSSVGRARDD